MRAENENWGDTVRNHLFDQRSAVMVHWLILLNVVTVSYTHLDVYKRQPRNP